MEYNAIDLFAGCGGLSLGLSRAGFDILYMNEINKTASETYRKNLVENREHNTFIDTRSIIDVSTKEIKKLTKNKKIHLVAGGPPCQGFSMAGRRDINDKRNVLFKEMLRVVKDIRPPLFLLENVKGILSMNNGKVIQTIKKAFEDLDYDVKIEVLKASNYGVPQDRERVFVIGTLIGNGVLHPTPDTDLPVTLKDAISDLEFLNAGKMIEEYILPPQSEYQKLMRKDSTKLVNHEAPKHSPRVIRRFSLLKEGQTGKDLSERFITKNQVFKRLVGNNPAKTVTTLP